MKLFIKNHTGNFKLRIDHASLLSRNHPSTNFSQFIRQWVEDGKRISLERITELSGQLLTEGIDSIVKLQEISFD